MQIVPFAPGHLGALDLQPRQTLYRPYMTATVGSGLAGGTAWSAVHAGRVVCCAGLQPIWPGRAAAWALFSKWFTPPLFLRLHLFARGVLDNAQANGLRRIETQIDPEFPQAVRWAMLLGFEIEGLMRRFLPDGREMYLVARIGTC